MLVQGQHQTLKKIQGRFYLTWGPSIRGVILNIVTPGMAEAQTTPKLSLRGSSGPLSGIIYSYAPDLTGSFYSLVTIDAKDGDYSNEGYFLVNNACKTDLFGTYKKGNEVQFQFTVQVFSFCLKSNAVNEIKFVRNSWAGFDIYNVKLSRQTPLPPTPSFTSLFAQAVGRYRIDTGAGGFYWSRNYSSNPIYWTPGRVFEGIAFYTFYASNPLYSTTSRSQLYLCYIGPTGRHFISKASNCEGYTRREELGYVENTYNATYAPRPLYRCHNPSRGHLITVNKAECTNNAFVVEGILGYIP